MTKPKKTSTFANHEVVTIALYLLQGDRRRVDTEDVAVKANELAPGRFTWRKYEGQINLETIRVYLSDAKKRSKGQYVRGTGNTGWQLTTAGLQFVHSRISEFKGADLSRESLTVRERRWLSTERNRLLSSEAYRSLRCDGIASVTRRAAENFFRVDDYIVGDARKRNVERLTSAFAADPELATVVTQLATLVTENAR